MQSTAAVGVGSLAAVTAAASATPAPSKWDSETDVVVVGSGGAGLSAAIAALESGAQVMVLEKAPSVGGTTFKSEGGYWIPNNYHMRAKNVADPKADVIRYMVKHAFPTDFREDTPRHGISERDYALIETYYDQGADIIEHLEKSGVLKHFQFDSGGDYYDQEKQGPAGRTLTVGTGQGLVGQLRAPIKAKGVKIRLRHRVTALFKNDRGEVIGVAVDTREGPINIRARRGVVFGTGGFTHNPDLMRTFHMEPCYGGCAAPTNQGDFVNIGIAAGAMLGNMPSAWRAELILEEALKTRSVTKDIWQVPGDSMIVVNKYGARVVDEKRPYPDRTRVHHVWDPIRADYPNQFLFMVYDRRTADIFGGRFPLPMMGEHRDAVITAPNLKLLAAAIIERMKSLAPQVGDIAFAPDFADRLQREVVRFNGFARRGKDADFERGDHRYDIEWHTKYHSKPNFETKWGKSVGTNPTLFPFQKDGPFHAIILAPGTLDTNGGPQTNDRSEVLDTNGNVIPGLYGAGNCIASPAGRAYWGPGGTLGLAITYGTIAGRNAARAPVKAA